MTLKSALQAALLVAIAGSAVPTAGSAQLLSGSSYYGSGWYGSSTGGTMMNSLGFTSICPFYYFIVTGSYGNFPLSIIQAYFPQCLPWLVDDDDGWGGTDGDDDGDDEGDDDGSNGDTGSGGGGTGGGGTGGGGTGGGGSGGGGTGGGGTGGGGTTDDDDGNDDSNDGDDGSGGGGWDDDGDWTDGGGTTAPEPVSLLLLGTGLAGVGGARAIRRRRSKS